MSKSGSILNNVFCFFKKFCLWVMTIFFILLSMALLPKPAGFAMLEAVLLVAPIEKWQDCIKLVIPKAWIKWVLVFVFIVLSGALM